MPLILCVCVCVCVRECVRACVRACMRGVLLSTVAYILSTMEGFRYRGGYLESLRGYLEYHWGCTVLWGIIDTCRDITSTMDDVQYL